MLHASGVSERTAHPTDEGRDKVDAVENDLGLQTGADNRSQLERFVQLALTRLCNARYFFTDSSTVRSWFLAVSSNYQVYVSHSIGEIQTLVEPEEWLFVPGKA